MNLFKVFNLQIIRSRDFQLTTNWNFVYCCWFVVITELMVASVKSVFSVWRHVHIWQFVYILFCRFTTRPAKAKMNLSWARVAQGSLTATVFSQNFRQINVLLKNFIMNWFDGKSFAWQWISRFSTLWDVHTAALCGNYANLLSPFCRKN